MIHHTHHLSTRAPIHPPTHAHGSWLEKHRVRHWALIHVFSRVTDALDIAQPSFLTSLMRHGAVPNQALSNRS